MNEIQTYNAPMTKDMVVAQKRLIREVMEAVMKEGTHYGIIPGCKQPSLYKAGSEAILSTFRIAVDPIIEDISTADCVRYRITLRGILPSGEVVGAGVGECSTDEDKYRWRSAVSDKEYDATPEDKKRIKYSRPSNYNQSGETKQIRTNPADLANTVLKMAKKRAQIDLTLTSTGASDVFVQDLEDLPEEVRDDLIREDIQKKGKPAVSQPQSKSQTDDGKKANEGQIKLLHVNMKKAGVTEADFKAHFGITEMADLPMSKVNGAIKSLTEGLIKPVEQKEEPLPAFCNECRTDPCSCEG